MRGHSTGWSFFSTLYKHNSNKKKTIVWMHMVVVFYSLSFVQSSMCVHLFIIISLTSESFSDIVMMILVDNQIFSLVGIVSDRNEKYLSKQLNHALRQYI